MKPKFIRKPLENRCWFCNERHCEGTLNYENGDEIPVHAFCAKSNIKRLKIRRRTFGYTKSQTNGKQAIFNENYTGKTQEVANKFGGAQNG